MSRITLYNTEIPPTQPVSGSGQVTVFAKDKAIYSIDEDGTLSGPFGGPGAAYRWSVLIPTYFQNLLAPQAAPNSDPILKAPQPQELGFPISDPDAKSIVGFTVNPIYNENEGDLTLFVYVNGIQTGVSLTIPQGSTDVVSSTGVASVAFEDLVWIAPADQQQFYAINGFVSITFSNVPVPA